VLGPGPDSLEYVKAIVAATNEKVSKILITYRHEDHVGATVELRGQPERRPKRCRPRRCWEICFPMAG
jgi:glyoxylase-like metal-dependent hydrolase (beta-lactamase superfamily II)